MVQHLQQTLKEFYLSTRAYTEVLCLPLETEDYVVQPSVDVSPPKWHLAHTTWFWEEFILASYVKEYKRFHPRYSFLFNSYYDSIGDRVLRLDRGNMSRPTVEEIKEFRSYVDQQMTSHFDELPEEAKAIINIGIHHEQQHQELLLTDIKYILGHNPLFPPYQTDFKETETLTQTSGYVNMESGLYNVGYNGNGFSFDNEHGFHKVFISAYNIRKGLVTNGEFLEFMESGGYTKSTFWHSDGWTWVNENRINAPLYWHLIDQKWYRYSLAGLQQLPLNEPVTHLSYYEAAAFAEWCEHRLPTEFEWESASDHFTWGQRWEHTNSAYLPYPGYIKPVGAIGEYNGKFMINQMVLRGSSVATPAGHQRKTYRNFFHPHLRWQFNGLRLVKKYD